jgi:diguanylate cyclase (GGDEF)-like protein
LRKARQSGSLAISAAHVLLRDRGLDTVAQQTSVVLAAPVYAPAFAGWVVLGVRGTEFLVQALRTHSQAAVKVVLDDPAGAGMVIAGISPRTRVVDDGTLARERTFTVGQRAWHLTVYPTALLVSRTDRWMAALVGGAGGLVTVMLAVLIGVLAGSRNRALEQVHRATTELREDIDRREAVEAQLREREEQLRHLAFHDPLTGLANRILFYDRVSHALLTHARNRETFAVLFIDLDGFKQINDRYGHAAGDSVLCEVAGRLRQGLRAGDTVARFGGDEFAVLVERLTDAPDASRAAERIVTSVRQPIDLGGPAVTVTASVGIAMNRLGDSADDILREADQAMYAAKTAGKSRYVIAGA